MSVINHLDQINRERSRSGIFEEKSYSGLLIDLLGISPHMPEKDEEFDIHLLSVGDKKTFTFLDSEGNMLHGNKKFKRLMKHIKNFSEETGRIFMSEMSFKTTDGSRCVFVTRTL